MGCHLSAPWYRIHRQFHLLRAIIPTIRPAHVPLSLPNNCDYQVIVIGSNEPLLSRILRQNVIYNHPWRFALTAVATNLILSSAIVFSVVILEWDFFFRLSNIWLSRQNANEEFFGPDLLQVHSIDLSVRPAPNMILMNYIVSWHFVTMWKVRDRITYKFWLLGNWPM